MTAIHKLPPPMLALLALGGLWWLSQRRAVAGSNGRVIGAGPGSNNGRAMPVYGTQSALKGPMAIAYGLAPNRVVPVTSNSNLGLLGSLLSFLGSQSNSISVPSAVPTLDQVAGYSDGGPSQGFYGVDQPLVRPAGYQPIFMPDSTGEQAAQDWALSNPTDLIFSPDPVVSYAPIANTGGFLDSL